MLSRFIIHLILLFLLDSSVISFRSPVCSRCPLWCLSVPLYVPWAALACQRDAVLRDRAALGEPMASGPPSPYMGPRLRLVYLLLGPLLLLLVSGLGTALGQKVYTNTWAVHIPGGQKIADRIANKHGFINYGHVSTTAYQPFLQYLYKVPLRTQNTC